MTNKDQCGSRDEQTAPATAALTIAAALAPFANLYDDIVALHGPDWLPDEAGCMRASLSFPTAKMPVFWREFRAASQAYRDLIRFAPTRADLERVRDFADELSNNASSACIDPDGDPSDLVSLRVSGEEGVVLALAMHRMCSALQVITPDGAERVHVPAASQVPGIPSENGGKS